MLVRAMHLGVAENLLPRDVFAPAETLDGDFVADYLHWDDGAVIRTLCAASDASPAGQVMRSLTRRALMKRVVQITFEELQKDLDVSLAGYAVEPDEKALAGNLPEAEALVAAAVGVDVHWVTLHWEDLKSPITSRKSFRVLSSDVLIVEGKTVQAFGAVSEIFSAAEPAARRSVAVYIRLPDGTAELGKPVLAKVRAAALQGLRLIAEKSMET